MNWRTHWWQRSKLCLYVTQASGVLALALINYIISCRIVLKSAPHPRKSSSIGEARRYYFSEDTSQRANS
jgi:hypothetical protein